MKFADRLKFTATGTSAATITFGAAVAGFRTLAQVIADGASDSLAIKVGDTGVPFSIDDGAGNVELSLFTITSSTVLTRTSVLSSSAGGAAAATFTGAGLSVFSSMPASFARKLIVATTDTSGNFTALLDPKGNVIPLGSSSSSVLIAPSGDTSGATDAAAINNMLAISSRVTLQPGGQYYCNTPIVVASFNHLIAYGARITLVAGVKGNVIINKAVIPTRTTNDGIYFLVSGNTTLSSLTANFTSADVGATVGLKGAGASNGTGAATWYAKVTATNTPTTVTAWTASKSYNSSTFNRPSTANGLIYQVTSGNGTTGTTEPTWPTTYGATVTDGTLTWTCRGASTIATLSSIGLTAVSSYTASSAQGQLDIFAAADRNVDVTVEGGTWVVTDSLGGGHLAGSNYRNSFASAFRRVDRLRIINTTWDSSPDVNTGGRFTISVADATSVDVLNTNFIRTGGDGVHLTGPISYALVQNVRGTTNDDATVANPQDFYTPYITDTEGSLTNLTFRDVSMTSSNSCAFRLYEGGVSGRFSVYKLFIENIASTSLNPAVVIGDATIDQVKLKNISGSVTASQRPLIEFNTPRMSGCEVDGATWNWNYSNPIGIILLTSPSGSLVFKNIRYNMPEGSPDFAAKNVVLGFQGSMAGVTDVTVDGFFATTIGKSGAKYYPNNVTLLSILNTDSLGSVNINLRNIQGKNTSGTMIFKQAAMNTPRISISHSNWAGPALLALPASETITTALALNNVGGTMPNLVTSQSPVKVEMVNTDVSTSGAMVALTGTGASAEIRLTNSAQLGVGALVSRDGTQSVRVRGTDISVDQTLLTPGDGDMIYNNNATPANGTGVAMYNTAAAKWKNLYSGVTN